MAVCNLFNKFTNPSGNFLLFSQYVEDVTKNYVNGDNYRVVPSNFIALNIDYSSKTDFPIKDEAYDRRNLSQDIPEYFQNVFENGCAYLRSKEGFNWTPYNAKYMFWNHLWKIGLISSDDNNTNNTNKTLKEVVYHGKINMHSYNEHNGMGYGDIYCYIPTSASKIKCTINVPEESITYDDSNTSDILIGRDGNYIFNTERYKQQYYYDEYLCDFDFSSMKNQNYYDINTIVLLYDIYENRDGIWAPVYEDIPMGMYFAGRFNHDGTLTNTIKKYVTTDYGSGTSYGLRICTRFLADPSGKISSIIETTEDTGGYANMSQLMSAMAENLSKMSEVTKSVTTTINDYKEMLAEIKNNRTNVPYIRNINGKDFWFVNGKMISEIDNAST